MPEPPTITTFTEHRQTGRVLRFDPTAAPYLDWNQIALTARQMGAHFEARSDPDGACTVTIFWSYTDEEMPR